MTSQVGNDSAPWISNGENFVIIRLGVKVEDSIPLQQLSPNLWVFADSAFRVLEHWPEWLGSIRTKEVECVSACNFDPLSGVIGVQN